VESHVVPDAQALLAQLADVIICYAPDGRVTWASPSLERIYGFEPSEVVGTCFRLGVPAEHQSVDASVADALDAGVAVTRTRIRTVGHDGSTRWADAVITPSWREDGALDYSVAVFRDVTELVLAEELAGKSEERFRLMVENASDAVGVADPSGRITWFSASVETLLGWTPEDLIGQSVMDLLHPDDLPAVAAEQERLTRGEPIKFEARVRRADGAYHWISSQVRSVLGHDGQVLHRVAGWRDIHDERTARQELAFLAYHDPLTGLRNRAWVLDILDTDLVVAKRDGSRLAVLFLDLDNFKVVNDSLGHVAGDDILVAAAHRISRALRPGDRIGRFGGDEFIVVAPGIHDAQDAAAVAARLTAAVTEQVMIDGRPVIQSASIGIALSDQDSTTTSLLRDADSALFRAKDAGRSRWEFSDPDTHTRAMARLVTEAELRTAITERQFVVHYQPIVTLADANLVGYEALVRWDHPDRGLVPPMEFLPVAEEAGLIVEIGDQVLDAVCDLLATRPDLTMPISVNKSPVQLGRPGWHDRFLARIHAQNIDPRRLVIELTETAILSIVDRTTGDLADLRARGVGIHVDDFGTGYSSIALLRELPVTGLKLDLSFTRHLTTDATARALAAGLAGLAAGLNLDGIAEGIETPEQARILSEQGWTYGQGYLFGRPAPMPPAARSGTRRTPAAHRSR
jgi:diguanylate cyclase (GGDEF)-like protein/PAS domain S-box-containing protein